MKFAKYSVLIFVLVTAFADDSPDILTRCPDFKPMENLDIKSNYKGRWVFQKLYGTIRTGATCSSINFKTVHSENVIEITYSSEFSGVVISTARNWTSSIPGEIILDTTVKFPFMGELRERHVYFKVSFN